MSVPLDILDYLQVIISKTIVLDVIISQSQHRRVIMCIDYEKIRIYKDRIRIFLILYYFSQDYDDPAKPSYKKVFKSEVKIQKIDFLVRNPDYLAYELLMLVKEKDSYKNEIRSVVKNIFSNKEPIIRRLEMTRFFFGAYENIDDVISFLKSIGFIEFESSRSVDMKRINKTYYVTEYATEKMKDNLEKLPSLNWYIQRCELIDNYFGDLNGTQLKVRQYQIDEYKNTSYKEYIKDIQDLAKAMFLDIYGEEL